MSWSSRPVPAATFELQWPRVVDEKLAASFFASLSAEAAAGPVVLEAISTSAQITHTVTLPRARVDATLRRLRLAIPGIRPAPLTLTSRSSVTRAVAVRLSSHRRSLRTDNGSDVAAGLLSVLSGTRRGEVLLLQWLLGPRLRAVAIPNRFQDFTHESWWQTALAAPLGAPGPVDPEFRKALRAKQGLAGWRAIGRLAVHAANRERELQLLHELLAALRVAEAPGLKLRVKPTPVRHVLERRVPWHWPSVLNEREIVGLAGWPLGQVNVPGISRSPSVPLPPSVNVPKRGRIIADSTFPGDERPLALSLHDSLQHGWVIGPTGVGKSTLLLNLLLQDLDAGRAAVLIDSKGDLVDDVLARVPEWRLDDIVVLDPADDVAPVGLNPLRGSRGTAPLLADQLLGVFHELYGDNLGPRSQDILHACFLTLARKPGMTICALPLLLSNAGFRRSLLTGLDDPLGLGSFWNWYESVSEAERQQAIAPVMNKLRSFLLRPAMRRVLGQSQPHFDLLQVFTERKVLLVSLAKGLLGPETAQLFGALVFNQLWQTVLGRVRIPAERRHPVVVYLDEFQNYLRLPTDLADVLAQARGLGVGLTLAHQHLGQLTPDVRAAVLANAGSRLCFRLNHDDAAVLARGSRLPAPEDFASLGRYEAYVSLLAGGERTPWASARTRAPDLPSRPASETRARSRETFGVAAASVEAELKRLITGPTADVDANTIGRRPRRGTS